MTTSNHSRRNFLKSGGKVLGGSWLAINMPLILSASDTALDNMKSGAAYKNLTPQEAVELDAIVDQIIPADETPGASEIGVVYFIDAALGTFMSNTAPMLRQGLVELQKQTLLAHPETEQFSDLGFEQQTALLKTMEQTPLFGMLQFMTMCGMFCLPSYGGNRENAGWELVGFDQRHGWQPPFGYYDRDAHVQTSAEGDEHEHI